MHVLGRSEPEGNRGMFKLFHVKNVASLVFDRFCHSTKSILTVRGHFVYWLFA
jgi:hypothetical protein